MMTGVIANEYIGYRRSAAVPGLQILDAYDSPREWRMIGQDFAITFIRDWRGTAIYRGRSTQVEHGTAFCNHPEEAFIGAPEAGRAGSFNVLLMSGELLLSWLEERGVRAARPDWRHIFPPISADTYERFARFSQAMSQSASALELQTRVSELADVIVTELLCGAAEHLPSSSPSIRGTARMRECLHEAGFDIDLETLAAQAGMSKYQALRAFKRRYGMPPYEYQLCLRICSARQQLLAGISPAQVAQQCGFVDQSHLTRHFKRIVGVTPMSYVSPYAPARALRVRVSRRRAQRDA